MKQIVDVYVDVDMDSVFALTDSLYYEFFSNLEVLFLKELNKLSNKEFIGDENKLFLNHANIPEVFTGGGRSGCVPGRYCLFKISFTFKYS